MAPRIVKFNNWSTTYTQNLIKENTINSNNAIEIKKHWNYFADNRLYKSLFEEEENLKLLVNALNSLDKYYLRSKQQLMFHKNFVAASLHKIFKIKYYEYLPKLIKEFELNDLKENVMIITPRRFGKTMSVCLYVAAWIFTQPDTKVIVYSTGKRVSMLAIEKIIEIYKKLCEIFKRSSDVIASNKEIFTVKGTGNKESTVSCYPSKEEVSFFEEERRFFNMCDI